jgi:hypothetical protein
MIRASVRTTALPTECSLSVQRRWATRSAPTRAATFWLPGRSELQRPELPPGDDDAQAHPPLVATVNGR